MGPDKSYSEVVCQNLELCLCTIESVPETPAFIADNSGKEYNNKPFLRNLSESTKNHEFDYSWMFYCAECHGKGIVDADGAVCKACINK